MAVRAQQLEVFEPIVQAIPVDVMKLHVEWLPLPLAYATPLAPVLL
jgi:hypothetical protein